MWLKRPNSTLSLTKSHHTSVLGNLAVPAHTANWLAQISTQEKQVDQSLSTETDQAIVSQDANVRFEDSARVLEQESILPLQAMWSKLNPYPEDTPATLLGRVVQLPDYLWTSTLAPIQLKLLTAFLSTSQIHQAILGNFTQSMYRFLQCDYRVTVRINSTPFHQGALIVNWCPDNYADAAVPDGTVGYASMKNTIVLSASQQDQCTLDIPYFQMNPHYDLAFPITGKWIDTRLNIRVLNPLITSSPSIVDSVPISVWIQMTNIHTYGILEQAALTGKSSIRPQKPFVEQSSKERVLKEAHTKDKQGLSAPGPLTIIKPIIRSIPFASDIIDGIKGLLDNLDKPRTDQSVTFTMLRPNRGHSMLTGVDFSEPLSSFPSCEVTKSLPMDNSDMSVLEYASIPALWYQALVTTRGVVLKSPVYPTEYSNLTTRSQPDYLAFASNFYRYFRGSMKFLFHFVGTPFYSCRFKISVVHSLNFPAGGTGDGTGFMSRIVDVKGDAWTSIVVPFLTRRVWNPTDPAYDPIRNYPWLIVEAVTDVQGSSLPATASYYMNVWRAAGPDFQLAQLVHNQVDYPPYPPLTEQTSLFSKFKEPAVGVKDASEGLHESGTYMADQTSTITDMMKRYVEHQPVGASSSYPADWSNPQVRAPIHLFSSSFLFWRGSRRIKVHTGDILTQLQSPQYNDFDPRSGTAIVLDNSDSIQVTVPWYCTELATPTKIARNLYNPDAIMKPTDLLYTGPVSPPTYMFIAAGDDFQYMYVVPPNPALFTPQPPIVSEEIATLERKLSELRPSNSSLARKN